MKWFKHDSNAHTDAKLEKLRIRYGMEGYGLYWYCLELIVRNVEHDNITFELEHDAEIISRHTGIHQDSVQEMMKHMVDLKLFENTDGRITCLKIAKRLDSSMTSNPELRKLLRKYHDSIMTKSDLVMPEEKRREEIRTEKNRKNICVVTDTPTPKTSKKFTKPTLQEIQDYCRSRHNDVDPIKFFNFYESKNWMVGKNPMKNWKAAVITWERSTPSTQSEMVNAI